MILDFLFQFTLAAGDSPTTGTQVSGNAVYIGVGLQGAANPSGLAIPGVAAGAGARDLGIGDDPALKVLVEVLTAFTGGTSLQVNLQGAPDSGTGTEGTYTTYVSGPVIAEANLIVGSRLLEIDIPRPPAGVALPRYLRLQYVTVGTHGAGSLKGWAVLDRFDQPLGTTGALSGYVPGITIPN